MATKTNKKANVPNLRFPGFEGEWQDNVVGEICKMQAGKFIKASEIFEGAQDKLFPCYGGNGLRGYTRSFNQVGQYSLIGRQGALCGNITFVEGKFYATEHAVVVTPSDKIDNVWMFYLLRYLNLNRYATGAAQPGLSVYNIERVEATVPESKKEQEKISSFLNLLDQRIRTQNKIIGKLETLIKGLRDKLFGKEGAPIPILRFLNFYKAWNETRLGDFTTRIVRRNKGKQTTLALTIAAKYGLVDQVTFFNKQIASQDMSNYYLLLKGEFAYNKSYSNDYPWGAIKRLDLHEKGALSSLYLCFAPNESVDSDYLVHYFETTKWHKVVCDISGEGARNHGLLNMSVHDFFDTYHFLPEIEEQRKIGAFLNKLSEKLAVEKEILVLYDQQKTALMNSLFI